MAEPSRLPEDGSPLREIPGLRKRERTWRDEVRERVAARQRKRAAERGDPEEPSEPPTEPRKPSRIRPFEPSVLQPRQVEMGPPPAPAPALDPDPPEAPRADLDDLPLQADVFSPGGSRPEDEPIEEVDADELAPPGAGIVPDSRDSLIGGDEEDDEDHAWELDLEPPPRAREGVERPAELDARALAAGIDALLLGSLYALVVYFASRAAQSAPSALASAWPWLASYMLLLGLAYAGCFTGLTGQTPGKMWAGIKVVDGTGRAPGVWYAVLRAAAAVVGIAAGGAGLIPVLLDPARRATHDRLLGTRVVTR